MKKIGLLGLLLIIPALFGCDSQITMETYENADRYYVGSRTYYSRPRTLDIYWMSGTITLIESGDLNGVSVVEKNQLDPQCKVHSYYSDGTLSIKYMASGHKASINKEDKNLVVTYNNGSLDEVNIKIISGDLIYPYHSTYKTYIDSINSNINIDYMSCSTSTINISGGTTLIDTLSVRYLDLNISGGDVSINHVSSEIMECNIIGGRLNYVISNFTQGRFTISGGSVNLTYPEKGGWLTFSELLGGDVLINREYTIEFGRCLFGGDPNIYAYLEVRMRGGSLVVD